MDHTTEYEYDKMNRKTKRTTPLGKILRWEYDGNGNIIKRIDEKNEETDYVYDDLNRLESILYPYDSEISYQYDDRGNLRYATSSAGTTAYQFDNFDRLTNVNDTNGEAITYQYDDADRLTSITYPGNKTVEYTYDAADRLVTVTDWNDDEIVYTYNDNGTIETRSFPNGVTTTYTYDDVNRVIRIEHAKGQTILAEYLYTRDSLGNIITATESGSFASQTPTPTPTATPTSTPSPTPTPAGVELLTSGAWHLSGNNGDSQAYQGISSNALQGKSAIRVIYDLHGLNALGGDASAIIFDQNGWKYVSLSSYGQNGYNGEQTVDIPLTDFSGLNPESSVGTLHSRFWYGSAFTVDITSIKALSNNPTPTPTPTPSSTPTPTPGYAFMKGINFNGNAVTIESNSWLSMSSAISDGLSVPSGYSTAVTSLTPNPSVDSDTNAMLNSAIWKDGGTTLSIDQTLSNNNYQIYLWVMENWANYNRKFNINIEGNQVATDAGYLLKNDWVKYGPYTTSVSDGTLDLDLVPTQDSPHIMGMAIYQQSGSPTPTPTSTPTPTPTPTGSPNIALNKSVTSSSNESSSLGPENAVDGNSGTRWGSAEGSDPQWIRVDLGSNYDINHVKLSWESAYASAYQIQTSTDSANWTSIYNTSTGDGGTDDLTVSGNGRYVRMYGTQRATQWGYSLWEYEVYGTQASGSAYYTDTVNYNYDPLNRLLSVASFLLGTNSYSYDKVGNMLVSTASGQTKNYGYNYDNQLTNIDSTSVSYDNRGNQISRNGAALDYDFDNRLVSVTASGTSEIGYIYDANGDRVGEEIGGTPVKEYVNDVSGDLTNVLVEKDLQTSTDTYYIYGLGLLSQGEVGDTDRQYYLEDGLGHIRVLTDNSGAVLEHYTFDSYGNQVEEENTSNFRFKGEQEDINTGLYYMRSRYYDPTTGRFISRDPVDGVLTNPQTQNGYNYTNGDPVNLSDPSGLLTGGLCFNVGYGLPGLSGGCSFCGNISPTDAGVTVNPFFGGSSNIGGLTFGGSLTVSNANSVKDLEGPSVTGGGSAAFLTGDYSQSKDSSGNTVHEVSVGAQTPTRFTLFGIAPLPADIHGGATNTYIPDLLYRQF